MGAYALCKCRCGEYAELIGEAPAKARYDEDGVWMEMWFTDTPLYAVRCTECDLETGEYKTKEEACAAWNTGSVHT